MFRLEAFSLGKNCFFSWNTEFLASPNALWTKRFFPTIYQRLKSKNFVTDFKLSQILTGHGNFNSYLSRFNLIGSDICSCGQDAEVVEHVLYCLITKLKVLDLLNIQPGFYTCRALQEADHARIRKAEKAISRRTKEARIKNRQLKCRQEDDLADDPSNPQVMVMIGTDHAHIRKAENAISQRTKQARIKNRLLKCRQEDDLADDPSNPQVMALECIS
ncbi:hypothetical protein TNCV_3758461 [Trichonephila clavipes]|nr:hypothetical protein TNCV_3758461 [Trichonephila clavipes]